MNGLGPKISVIIPVLNREKFIERTLNSVFGQNVLPHELIIVDNGSTDNTLKIIDEIVKKYAHLQLPVKILHEPKQSAAGARHTGATNATGEWFVFFDSDDVMLPNLVKNYAKAILHNPLAQVIITNAVRVNYKTGKVRNLPFFLNDLLDNHILHAILATQRYAIRRETYQHTLGWDANFTTWDDWEMGVRILLQNPVIDSIYSKEPQVLWTAHADSITGNDFYSKAGAWEKAIDAVEQYVRLSPIPTEKHRERLMLYINHRRITLAAAYRHENHPELAQPLLEKALSSVPSKWNRAVMRMAYWHAPRRGATLISTTLYKI